MNNLPESLEQIPDYLLQFSPSTMAGHYDLGGMRQLLHSIGDPQQRLKVIHVAGTSGKTSTAYFVRALLESRGLRVGLTVSPHILDIRERVQVGGILPPAVFHKALHEFLQIITDKKLTPTYFELLIAFAYWYFARQSVDYAVVEVGLGGLLDGTNVVERADKVCIINMIGLDHTEILGDTLPQIADQKLGIIQPGNQTFIISQGKNMDTYLMRGAKQRGGMPQLVEPVTDLHGLPSYQAGNTALALAADEFIAKRDNLPPRASGVTLAPPPGRFETITHNGLNWIVDGAHNPQELLALKHELDLRGMQKMPVLVSFTQGPSEKLNQMVAIVATFAANVVVVDFQSGQDIKSKRSFSVNDMQAAFEHCNVPAVTAQNIPHAIEQLSAISEPQILVTGSLYLVSAIIPYLATD